MVSNRQRGVRVSLRGLSGFSRRACAELGLAKSAVAICLVTDDEIARWNLLYRGKHTPTDVLSFPSIAANQVARSAARCTRRRPRHSPAMPRAKKVLRSAHLGDIAIAPAVARQNARELGRTLEGELRALILHGMLHLMGYDHETDDGEMERLERRLRRRLDIA
jgi:probable rRNA maturation factor